METKKIVTPSTKHTNVVGKKDTFYEPNKLTFKFLDDSKDYMPLNEQGYSNKLEPDKIHIELNPYEIDDSNEVPNEGKHHKDMSKYNQIP